jgi:predicted AlkP superfamily phosphohydrolase/phosphomutase
LSPGIRLPRWTVYPAVIVLIGLPFAFVPWREREEHPGAAAAFANGALLPGTRYPGEAHPRVVVIGIDGLDPDILEEVVARYPERTRSFQWLIGTRGVHRLGTSNPPQSPVAWSNFTTGLDPGGHGIFDFIHRDPHTRGALPSTTRESAPSFAVKLMGKLPLPGEYVLPVAGTTESNRTGAAFWTILKQNGVPADIWRMPANFPVIASNGWSFSGMMTPALDSAYGECTLYTTDALNYSDYHKVQGITEKGGVYPSALAGPANSFKQGMPPSTVPIVIRPDLEAGAVALDVGDSVTLVLKPGQWSEFVPVVFALLPASAQDVQGIVRFYLRSMPDAQGKGELELYASPINIDPSAPAMDVSEPGSAAADVAARIGPYYTQGMAEDVGALKRKLISENEFMQQVDLVYDESRRMLDVALDRYVERKQGGLLFFYFSTVDLASHMMWRLTDPRHPAYDPALAAVASEWYTKRAGSTWKDAIDDLVLKMDPVLGEMRERVGEGATYILMSDHGFAPYRRAFSLNTWLLEQGYLVLREGIEREGAGDAAEAALERNVADVIATRSPVKGAVAAIEPTVGGGSAIAIEGAAGGRARVVVPAGVEVLVSNGSAVDEGQELSAPYSIVDWSKTRAYGIGFQGLYLNQRGRELDLEETQHDESGCVDPAATDVLLREIREKLLALRDPKDGARVVFRCDLAREIYSAKRILEAPDLVVGYDANYGNSDASTEGRIPPHVLEDNLGGSFNGSHLMAPDVVQGTLLSNLPVLAGAHALEDLTVEVLRQFQIPPGEGMLGKPVLQAPR